MIGQNNLLPQYIRVRMNHNIITTVNLVQGDTAREFHFVFDDYIVPENSQIYIYIQKPSGLEFYGECELKNNEIIVQPKLQMVAEKGKNLGQMQIVIDGSVINTFIFYLAIEPNLIYSSSITSTNEFEVLSNLITEARTEITQLKTTTSEVIESLENLETAVEEAESNRVVEFNEKIGLANDAITDINNTIANINEVYDKANDAYVAADESINKLNEVSEFVDDTVKKLNDAVENLEGLNPIIISTTQPPSQNLGELWFVETIRE